MNCKPGDLAIVVPSRCHSGEARRKWGDKIVQCVRLVTDVTFQRLDGTYHVADIAWVIDPPLPGLSYGRPGPVDMVRDTILRPIRGTEGDDETLSWKEVPKPRVIDHV